MTHSHNTFGGGTLMRSWRVHDLGEPTDALSLDEIDEPTPGPGQVKVKVLAAPANFPDVLLCRGEYQIAAVAVHAGSRIVR